MLFRRNDGASSSFHYHLSPKTRNSLETVYHWYSRYQYLESEVYAKMVSYFEIILFISKESLQFHNWCGNEHRFHVFDLWKYFGTVAYHRIQCKLIYDLFPEAILICNLTILSDDAFNCCNDLWSQYIGISDISLPQKPSSLVYL